MLKGCDGCHCREFFSNAFMISSGLIQGPKNPPFWFDLARDESHREVKMQSYPISDNVRRPQAEDKVRLAWFNSDLESSFGRWIETRSFVEKEDLSGYVFDDSLLLVSFVDEKGSETR